jgi:surface antigen
MTPVLLFSISRFNKKYIYLIVATLAIILMLPVMAVFALGQGVLSFLSFGGGTSISTQSDGLYEGPLVPGDTYAWGNCTYWVYLLRQQAGDPIPNNWGNAATWASNAKKVGYLVDQLPTVGSIMQTSFVDNGLGHVAYVTTVDPTTGAWTISEMNVQGLDIVDTKTLQASAAFGYNFIHDKVN